MEKQKIYLDNAATTPLSQEVKDYIVSILDMYQNPSSLYQDGVNVRKIVDEARSNVAKFINGSPENVIFTSGGSAANSLAIKGLVSDNPFLNYYNVFYSPTAHKSMIKACQSCAKNEALKVNINGEIDIIELTNKLTQTASNGKPLVCIEAANSEIGSINMVELIGYVVHQFNGILLVDATGYIPSLKVDMQQWKDVDILTFSAHKLNALKGVGVLYKQKNIELKPLIYGAQENGLFGGTENVIGIASLGKAVENYDYSFINSTMRDYIYEKLIKEIPDCYLAGTIEFRLPHNLYMCFKGIEGEALMMLLDEKGIQVSTGSACNSGSPLPSQTLVEIGIPEEDIHSGIRITLSGKETTKDCDFVCSKIKETVKLLRKLN